MFGLTGIIDNTLDVVGSVFSGEDIPREKVSKLLSDGISIAVIAHGFGVAEDVIQSMIDED